MYTTTSIAKSVDALRLRVSFSRNQTTKLRNASSLAQSHRFDRFLLGFSSSFSSSSSSAGADPT